MSGSIRVAVTQPVASADPRRNGRTTRELMRRAAGAGARLVLLPEGHLSGYAKEQVANWDRVDWRLVREEVDAIAALAAYLRIWTVVGSAHPLTAPALPHNSMYVISDRGEVVERYDKRICSATESAHYFTPGSRPVTVDVDGYRFGIATCIEVNFPHLFEEYAALGVDGVLLPTYPVDEIFETKARALAAIFSLWVAVSSVDQARGFFPSQIVGPDGRVTVRVAGDADLGLATLDRSAPELHVALDLARPWRSAARTAAPRRAVDARIEATADV